MNAMLLQRRLELREKLLGHFGRIAAGLEPGDELLLPSHMALRQGDVVVHHLEIGRTIGHASV